MKEIVVPVDGSAESWEAVIAACNLAEVTGAEVVALTVEARAEDERLGLVMLNAGLKELEPGTVLVRPELRLARASVASEIESYVAERRVDGVDSVVVMMSTHGRGRSSAVLGSIALDVLRRTGGPLLLLGPRARPEAFTGPVVITVDGSELSERAIPYGLDWAERLGVEAWVVHCSERSTRVPSDVAETNYVAGLAHRTGSATGRTIEFDELHGSPARAVADDAMALDASMIVTATHGRSGWSRLVVGSVAADIVRYATCPVLLVGPESTPSSNGA